MRSFTNSLLGTSLVLGLVFTGLAPNAHAGGPGNTTISWLSADGGDVLRPYRGGGAYHWYLGLDAGLTYAMFSNGQVFYTIANPYFAGRSLIGNMDEGTGLGFSFGATADFPVSDIFGIVLKGHYHTRAASFDETLDLGPVNDPIISTVFGNKSDLTLEYLGLDLLLRANFGSLPLYLLVGPGFASLMSNTIKLDQAVLSPPDYYYEEGFPGNTPNEFVTATSEAEVQGFMESRVDLKVGLGYRIPLTETLDLTPEAMVALPLTDLIDTGAIDPAAVAVGLVNPDFNDTTVFFTLGLRWRIGS